MTPNDYCIASSEFVHIFFLVALYSLLSDKHHFIVLSVTSNINTLIAWLRTDTLECYKILIVKLHDLFNSNLFFFSKSRLAH